MTKWYRCEPHETARVIAREGYRTPDQSIWLSKDEPMTEYGEVCFEVKLPKGTEEVQRDDEGSPIRASFRYPGESIPPENFHPVTGENLLIDVVEETVISRHLWKLSVETSRLTHRPNEEEKIPVGYATVYYGDGWALSRYLENNHYEESSGIVDGSYLDYIEVVRGRGKGIGSALLERMISELKRRKIKELFLHVSPGDRYEKARELFFRRFGFRAVRCCPEEPKLMRLELP